MQIFEVVKCGCWCGERSILYWCTCRMPYSTSTCSYQSPITLL